MALVFWTEPVPTFDLDVLVLLSEADGASISLDTIYRWAEAHDYAAKDEHVLVEGLPTQFIPCPNPLSRQAIAAAAELDYQAILVRVVRPEYSLVMELQRLVVPLLARRRQLRSWERPWDIEP